VAYWRPRLRGVSIQIARATSRGIRRGVGGEDRALVDDPAGAGVGLANLLDHLDVGRQVQLAPAHRAGEHHVEQTGVGQRLEDRRWQHPLGLGVAGVGADHGRELSSGLER